MEIFGFKLKALILLWGFVTFVYSAPAPTMKTPPPPEQEEAPLPEADPNVQPADTGLYYDQYLQTVVKLLESDENFRKKMENANFEDIKSGKFSGEVYKIPDTIRTQLDDAKKEEVNRLRKISHAKMQVEKGQRIRNSNTLKDIASHLDVENVNSFEAQDLTNLIKAATKDLENFDEKRHQEFKRYQMTKEMRRQEKLRQMGEQDRIKAEKEYQELKKKHEDHPAMNHPGSKAQLNEVWEEEDGLKGQEFSPKTFFRLHDLNGDNFLDPMELEALFEKDLAKVYDSKNEEDDMMEMEEERRRMRKHVMKEVDYDSNGLIGFEEFMKYSGSEQFNNPDQDSYKTVDEMIDDSEVFTHEELDQYRKVIADQEKDLKEKLDSLRQQAQNVVSLKSEVYQHQQKLGPNPQEHEKEELEDKKIQMEQEERVLKEMHEDLREQSKDIREMKEELKKQEENTLNQHPPGDQQPLHNNQQFQGDYQYQQPPQGDQQYQQPGHGDQRYQQPPQGGQQYQQPSHGGQQYQQPSHGSQQYQQPPQGDQQYQQPDHGDQQFQQPPQSGQQYQQPSHDDQQYQQPSHGSQQYQQPPQGSQQHQQPPQDGQQYQQPPQDGQQYQQPSLEDSHQYQQPQGDGQYQESPPGDQQPSHGDQQYQQPAPGDQQYQQASQGDQQYQQPPQHDERGQNDEHYQQPPIDHQQQPQDFVDAQFQAQEMQHH